MNFKATKKIVFKLRLGLLFFVVIGAIVLINISPAEALLVNYTKVTTDRLEAIEWNYLLQDFVTKNNGGDVLLGNYSINTGTSTAYALDVGGSLRASSISGSTGSIFFKNASTDLMTILASGYVGIGTTTPDVKLNVYGTVSDTIKINDGYIAGLNLTPVSYTH